MIYDNFANLVREKRESRQMTQKELADICGLSRGAIMHIELGNQRVFLDQALRISLALDISLEEMKACLQRQIFDTQLANQPESLQAIIRNSLEELNE